MKVVVVALAGFLIGGWAVPLGFVLGISPVVTLLVAAGEHRDSDHTADCPHAQRCF